MISSILIPVSLEISLMDKLPTVLLFSDAEALFFAVEFSSPPPGLAEGAVFFFELLLVFFFLPVSVPVVGDASAVVLVGAVVSTLAK